jgi:hypothetical protein
MLGWGDYIANNIDKNDVYATSIDTQLIDKIDSSNIAWKFIENGIIEDARLGIQPFSSLINSMAPKKYESLARNNIGGTILNGFDPPIIANPNDLNQLYATFMNNKVDDDGDVLLSKNFYDGLESQTVD